jgi:hypothetical protein
MNQVIEIINKVMSETNDPDYYFQLKEIKERIESILPLSDHNNVIPKNSQFESNECD